MALKAKYNLKVFEADTAEEIAEKVFASNELVTALDSGESKLGNGVDTFSELPVFGGGGGEGGSVAWGDITEVPAALTAAQAAGTASIRAIGTTATTAAAGNHTHAASAVTATAIAPGTATNVQGILAELAARIAALENA